MQIILIFKNSENYFLIQCNLNNTINLNTLRNLYLPSTCLNCCIVNIFNHNDLYKLLRMLSKPFEIRRELLHNPRNS